MAEPVKALAESRSGLAKYRDLVEAFNEKESNVLPSHRPMDCVIEILPDAKLPKPKMYTMTPREIEELRSFVDGWWIYPASKILGGKPLFAFQGWVYETIGRFLWNEWSMCQKHVSVMKDMLGYLSKGKVFIKSDLREAYY